MNRFFNRVRAINYNSYYFEPLRRSVSVCTQHMLTQQRACTFMCLCYCWHTTEMEDTFAHPDPPYVVMRVYVWPQDVKRIDYRKACEHFNQSYHNPAEFRLVLTGNVRRDTLIPMLLKYVATIPKQPAPVPRALKDVTPLVWTPPTQPVTEDVRVSTWAPVLCIRTCRIEDL